MGLTRNDNVTLAGIAGNLLGITVAHSRQDQPIGYLLWAGLGTAAGIVAGAMLSEAPPVAPADAPAPFDDPTADAYDTDATAQVLDAGTVAGRDKFQQVRIVRTLPALA